MITDNTFNIETAPIQQVYDPAILDKGINLFVKREDLVHPFIHGNKWYKLKYNIIEAKRTGYDTILTFGGAYSNHIHATASAGKFFNFNTIGIVRGEEHLPLNPTLKHASECGMKLFYMDRDEYRRKNEPGTLEKLHNTYGKFYFIPEGGSNQLGVKGSEEIIENVNLDYDYVFTACGTGGTLAGIISALKGEKQAIGITVLKDAFFLKDIVKKLIKENTGKEYSNWNINTNYHFGGYANFDQSLLDFVANFYNTNNIPIEPIYTGKLFFALYDLIKKGFFKKNDNILAIHTGGLQGIKGFEEKYGLKLF